MRYSVVDDANNPHCKSGRINPSLRACLYLYTDRQRHTGKSPGGVSKYTCKDTGNL